MKTATKYILVAFGALMQCACSVHHPNALEARPYLAHVTVHGEVKKHGQVEVSRDFTLESFLAGVGGFTYGSNLGATPTHFILKRGAPSERREMKIFFKDMPELRKKGFTFEDGDEIWVPRLLF